MKLAIIVVIAFIAVAMAGTVGGTYYFYLQSNELLEDKVVDNLESTSQALEHFIEEILEEQEEKLEIAATHSDLSIEELKEIRDLQEEFFEVFVLDSNGVIIVSSDEPRIGEDKSGDAYFLNARQETYITPAYFSETTKKESIAIATPFNEGVLVARIELEAFDKIVSDRTGLGETGEALLAYESNDGSPVFFTQRRFEAQALTTSEEEHSALPMREALAGNEGIFFGVDYRNVPVIAITKYVDKINVGMVVKIDEAEALGAIRNKLIQTAITLIILISVCVSVVGFFVARLISNPLKKLTQEVDKITKGKLDVQLEKNNIYEMQKLTESLNRILASLKLAILRTGMSKTQMGIGKAIEAKEEAEKKFEESEQMWRTLAENAPNVILILNPDSTIKYINHTIGKTSKEETVGKSIYDFIDPAYHAVAKKTISQVFETGKPGMFESRAGPQEQRRWFDTQVGVIMRKSKIVAITFITSDVTEVKKARETLNGKKKEKTGIGKI